MWLAFIAIVVVLLCFDLGVLHRDQHEIGVAESLWLSAGYISVALLFGIGVWTQLGAEAGMAYYTAFLIEKSLSLDNVFVISLIFTYLAIPRQFQHRALFWGILGVIVLRAILIGVGAQLVTHFSWILYVFGGFLLLTGVKMLLTINQQPDIANNPVLRWLRKHMNITAQLHGEKFLVRLPSATAPDKTTWWATPLLLALIMIELVDLVFAVDSVPAVFAITPDPFIVYTSNIFAILGLRALYFALAAIIHRFAYLKHALAAVLIFIGAKIFLVGLIGKIPAVVSLGVTFSLIAGGVLFSLWKTRASNRLYSRLDSSIEPRRHST